MIKQNFHTHSCYDDGKDTIDQMAQTALEKGFTLLGWSGHGFNRPLDDCSMTLENHEKYRQDILAAQKKYQGRLKLLCGIEQDSMNRLNPKDYDYIIGSVHFIEDQQGKYWPVDYSKEVFEQMLREGFGNDVQAMIETYYQAVAEMAAWPEVDIIGHVDLIGKFNENQEFFHFDAPWYVDAAKQAIDAGIRSKKIFEMNTGAISRGYRTSAYPEQNLLQYMADHDARLCINTDCHGRENLDLGITECLQRALETGFTSLYTWKEDGFVPEAIDQFAG